MKRDAAEMDSPGVNNGSEACCRVEAIISIDQRGQLVLPKELRLRARIGPGDKLAVTSWERNGDVCCLTLTKVEGLAEIVKETIGPAMKVLL